MKKIIAILLLGLLFVGPAFATNKLVTTVSATVSTILTPAQPTIITIQNNGSGAVMLGLDGGTTNRQKSCPDPTATTGYLLSAGSSLTLSIPPGSATIPQIRAILVTGTTTSLLITTNDPFST